MTTAIALLFGNLFKRRTAPLYITYGAEARYMDEPEYELILTQPGEEPEQLKKGALDEVLDYADGSIQLKGLKDALLVSATGETISVLRGPGVGKTRFVSGGTIVPIPTEIFPS